MKNTAIQLNTETWKRLFPHQDKTKAIHKAAAPETGDWVDSKIAGKVITAKVTYGT